MSSSAAFASSPAPDADSFGLRPLDAIAATSSGGVPQSRVHRILTDLAAPLTALHEQGRMHGALSPATIGLDMNGTAHLMPRPPRPGAVATENQYPGQGPAEVEDELDLPLAGYAAFEQYADDELLPRGPWTDVYGLSAVACQLITGAPPPDADARRDGDEYVPLAQRMPAGYDAAFLSAVDAGLAMASARRPNSMAAYLALFGGMEPAPAMPALSEPEVVVVQDDYDEEDDDEPEAAPRRRLSFWGLFIVLLAAVVAVPVWLWLSGGNGASGIRMPGVGGSGGSSFVPLSQLDARPAGASRPAGESGTGAAGGAATPGGSPEAAATGTSSGNSDGNPNGSPPTIPAAPQNGTSDPASTSPTTSAAGAGPAAGSGGSTPAAAEGSDTPATGMGTGTPDAASAPRPYHSTVTLGGGASATAGAQGPRAGEGSSTEAASDAAGKAAKPAAAGAPVPVRIDVRPWGEIVVDGVARGVSPPLKELRLTPGKHSVIIRNTGLPTFRMTLEVKAGTPATISHVFN